MPIWFELVVVALVAYGAGLGLGWLLWGRELAPLPGIEGDDE